MRLAAAILLLATISCRNGSWAAILIATIFPTPGKCLAGTAATQPATKPAAVWSDERGQLRLTVLQPGTVPGYGREVFGPTSDGWKFDRSIDGSDWCRVSVEVAADRLEVTAYRWPAGNWRISTFRLIQKPGLSRAEVVVRTPAGLPDWSFAAEQRHTADLAADPTILALLNETLADLGQPGYDAGEFVHALRSHARPAGWVALKTADAVARLDARDWRVRDAAREQIDAMGWPGTLALRRMDRRGMTCEQRRGIDELLSEWPKGE